MAKFLNTTGISYHLEQLIGNTKDRLILVSPYLQLNERIKELIKNLTALKKDIRIIYRENKLAPDEVNWLDQQVGVRTSYCNNLHAKCYINDQEAIITSMNLYNFSQQNNNEIGVYITKAGDEELFNDTLREIQRLLTISTEIRVSVQKVAPANNTNKAPTGYCIRTGVPIPFNIERPMSLEAYRKWEEYSNEDYPEKYCHFSGEQSDGSTSMRQPVLSKNWKKAKEIFKL
jgi:phosphatidylserine/phosphatidylglycerophosphate/cardiolipin synthase-like enzyme